MTQPPSQLPPAAAAQSAKRNFWQRRVRDPLVAQLTQGITPEKIALTLAVGTACALFPIIGMTTLLCALAAIALRLNPADHPAPQSGLLANPHSRGTWLHPLRGKDLQRPARLV
ncbi:MAG: DUF2062 domain-containing protein [Nibricoccus sp.]